MTHTTNQGYLVVIDPAKNIRKHYFMALQATPHPIEKYVVRTAYGRIGHKLRDNPEECFSNHAEAVQRVEEIYNAKRKKGYRIAAMHRGPMPSWWDRESKADPVTSMTTHARAYLTDIDPTRNTSNHYFAAVVRIGDDCWGLRTAFGRIGNVPTTNVSHDFDTFASASISLNRCVSDKRKLGYREAAPAGHLHVPPWWSPLSRVEDEVRLDRKKKPAPKKTRKHERPNAPWAL